MTQATSAGVKGSEHTWCSAPRPARDISPCQGAHSTGANRCARLPIVEVRTVSHTMLLMTPNYAIAAVMSTLWSTTVLRKSSSSAQWPIQLHASVGLQPRPATWKWRPLSQSIPGGAAARPFITHHNALGIPCIFRIADEAISQASHGGDFEGVYEFSKNFRNEAWTRTLKSGLPVWKSM